MKIKTILAAITAALLLTACGTPSVEDYKADKEMLKEKLQDCAKMNPADARADEGCMNAARAYQQLLREGVNKAMKGLRR